MTSKLEQFKSIFTEHTDEYLEIITSFTKLEKVTFDKDSGCAAFKLDADFGYFLCFEIYSDGCATVTACKLIRKATWEEPEEYDEKEYDYDDVDDISNLKEFLDSVVNKYTY